MAYFTTKEVKKYAGFESTQMVDYLYRTGIVIPSGKPRAQSGRGRARLYTLGDVVLLRAINHLLQSGLPVSRLKKAIETARKNFRHMRPDTIVAKYLITDGCDVFFNNDAATLTNLNKNGQMAFAFIIDVAQAKDDVVKAATEDNKFKSMKSVA